MTPEEELTELIASFTTGKGEVEVVELNHSAWPEPLYLTPQLKDGAEVDIEGVLTPAMYAPMTIGGESSGSLLLNNRDLTIQGINDLVSTQEALIPYESEELPVMKVRSYVASRDGTLTTVAKGPLKYFAYSTDYNQAQNGCVVSCSTTKTNGGETGETQNINRFPSLRGFI